MEDDTERVLGDYLLYTCGNFSVNSFLLVQRFAAQKLKINEIRNNNIIENNKKKMDSDRA